MTLVAPRIGNDVSYVPQIAGDVDFALAGAAFGEVGC